MDYTQALFWLKLGAFLLALAPGWLLARQPASKAWAGIAGPAWILLASAEFWILGGRSFVPTPGELEYSLSLHQYMANWHAANPSAGGSFSHGFAGGHDVRSMAVVTGQLLSFERFLLGSLPLGLAALLQKLSVFGLGYWGTYLLARRGFGADRFLAFGMGALFILSHQHVAQITWAHGVGYALAPLAAYISVCRHGRRFYWSGVLALASFHAISCSPTHSGIAFFPALCLIALVFGPRALLRAIPAIAVFLVLVLVNFAEAFYAMASLAPFSFRGAAVVTSAKYSMWPDSDKFLGRDLAEITILTTLLGVAALWRAPVRALSAIAALLVATFAGVIFLNLPWERIGLAPLRGFSFHNIDFAYSPVALAAIAAFGALLGARHRLLPVIGCLVFSAAMAKFAYYKGYNLSNWLSQGGLAILADGGRELERPAWRPAEPVRTITVPYRLHANMAVGSGLDSLDGNLNVLLSSMASYWRGAVLKHPLDMSSGFLTIETKALDVKCCASYDITQYVDLDALRLANVGFVLSKLPLTGLQQVAGPTGPSGLPRSGDPLRQRIERYLELILKAEPIRVYRISDPLPRVYALRRLVPAVPGLPESDFYARVKACVDQRCGIVAEADALPSPSPDLGIIAFHLGRDAISVAVEATSAGAIAVSTPWLPFWRAMADGKPVRSFAVNGMQMGIEVPAGTRRIELRYAPPSLLGTLGLG